MKSVYMMTDIEGVSGVNSHTEQSYSDGRYHDLAKRLLTAEINAAVEGLLLAGVQDILVCDGHGSGGVWFEDLHPAAKLLHGRPSALRSIRDPIVDTYDAAIMVGQHAMAGVATSNQNHTQSSRTIDYIKLNGQLIGEIAQFALYQGAAGQPMFFLSGEQEACLEAQRLIEGVHTVSVKQGLGRGSAISLSAPEARKRIREGVQRAVEHQRAQPIPPLTLPGPYVLEKRYFHTDSADAAQGQGFERVDGKTVRLRGEDLRSILFA